MHITMPCTSVCSRCQEDTPDILVLGPGKIGLGTDCRCGYVQFRFFHWWQWLLRGCVYLVGAGLMFVMVWSLASLLFLATDAP